MNSKKILIGVITSPHGIKGAVKVKFFTDDFKNLLNYSFFDANNQKINFTNINFTDKSLAICFIDNVSNRNEAENLSKTQIYINRDSLPETYPGEFYIRDLVECEVKDEELNIIGKVKEVLNFGAGDIVEVEFTDKTKKFISFNGENFPTVNIEKKFLIFKVKELDLK